MTSAVQLPAVALGGGSIVASTYVHECLAQDLDLQMVGFPTDKQPAGSAWWDTCPNTSADFGSSAAHSNQVGLCQDTLQLHRKCLFRTRR